MNLFRTILILSVIFVMGPIEVQSETIDEQKTDAYLYNLPEREFAEGEGYILPPLPKIEAVYQPCSVTSYFKSYMDYRMITSPSSKQYKLQQNAYTEDGYRKVDGRMMVAMANFSVGDKLDIHLSSGEVLQVIIGDIKASTTCAHPDGSILEFIVDTRTMDKGVRVSGNFNDIYEGTIKLIEKIR